MNKAKVKNFFLSNGLYLIAIVIIVAFTAIKPSFFSGTNLFQILTSSSFLFAMAAGTTVVIIGGNMDLSVGSTALVCAATMWVVSTKGAATPVIVLAGLAVGAGVGLLNGVLVSYLKMNSMVLTLGLQIAYRGLGLILINGTQQSLPEAFKNFGSFKIGKLYSVVILCFAVMIVLHIILRHTKFGTYIYAMGSNEEAARRVGIPVNRIKLLTFVISGLCAAVAGLVIICRLGMVQSFMGKGMEFDAIEAAVIGGVSLNGGRGRMIPGTIFGVLLIYMINNGLALIGASEFSYPFAQGILVFIAMYMDALKNFKSK